MGSAIWKTVLDFVGNVAPALLVGLLLSAGVQWLVERSYWAAGALPWVARSVPGAALAGAVLPGCSMTTVPLAIPLKRQGARDGALLAFIITSALLGPASVVMTFAMFGPAWGILRILNVLDALDVGVCLDTGHAFLSGEFEHLVRKLMGHLKMLHIHDNRGRDDEHLVPGDGFIDWEMLLRELARGISRGHSFWSWLPWRLPR